MQQALTHWLEALGILNQNKIIHNPNKAKLVSEAICKQEGALSSEGALVVNTSPFTGRSAKDKFIVDDDRIPNLWWGNVNRPISKEKFNNLQNRITAYLNNRDLYIIDGYIGADEEYRLSLRVVTEFAWQALAAQHLFITDDVHLHSEPDITILATPGFITLPELDHVRSKAAVCLDLRKKIVLIAGSKYFGEIKKSAFTIMNSHLPSLGVLPMHCSANVDDSGDVALYFGLSGTGKTTLSSTPDRRLIGDDEHGWSDNGIFNFEGGCYAKTIRLDPDLEPVIWRAVNQFGSVLENVALSPEARQIDFDDGKVTQNTRAAYPLSSVKNIVPEGYARHPSNIFFLTADAFGVMPPIAKLEQEQVLYYFLTGYTSKLAGTERDLGNKPHATFSTCFGEPFLPLTPNIYADLLKEKIDQHGSKTWLVNTGWTGGDYSTGYRMPLKYTRRMINWILSGEHQDAIYHKDPIFNLSVPNHIDGIPDDHLYPGKNWDDQSRFKKYAYDLKEKFQENYQKFETLSQVLVL